MNIAGKIVTFRLSSQGQQALSGLIVDEGASLPALVVDADNIGAWIFLDRGRSDQPSTMMRIMLLKWEYVAEAAFELEPPEPTQRDSTIGFRSGSR